MATVTNNTRSSLDFVTGMKNGDAVTESLAAGETRDLDVDAESAQVRGRILSGAISLPTKRAARAERPST